MKGAGRNLQCTHHACEEGHLLLEEATARTPAPSPTDPFAHLESGPWHLGFWIFWIFWISPSVLIPRLSVVSVVGFGGRPLPLRCSFSGEKQQERIRSLVSRWTSFLLFIFLFFASIDRSIDRSRALFSSLCDSYRLPNSLLPPCGKLC